MHSCFDLTINYRPVFISLFSIPSLEVANREPYNEKCDIYSFALVFWEMLALKTPFGKCTMSKLYNEVWNGEEVRPRIDPNWQDPIKLLLERSWNPVLSVRPSFAEVTKTLRKQCIDANGGNDEGLSHSRRRSTFIFSRLNSEILRNLADTISTSFTLGDKKR